jgi:hypothetical protein
MLRTVSRSLRSGRFLSSYRATVEARVYPLDLGVRLEQEHDGLVSGNRNFIRSQGFRNLRVSGFEGLRQQAGFSAGVAATVKDHQGVSSLSAPKVKLFVGGEAIESQATECVDVVNPATQEVLCRVPLTTSEEFEATVKTAKEAYATWRNTPVTTRQRIMLKLQELIRRDMEKLALSVTLEQGKTIGDARGDVFRGLEVSFSSTTNAIVQFKLPV